MYHTQRQRGAVRHIAIAAVAVAAAVALFFLLLLNVDTSPSDQGDTPQGDQPSSETDADTISEWETYTNETYNFAIEHPRDWRVHAFPDDPGSPKFNITPNSTDTSELPFTHHSQDVTHVSIFPHGVPTEGFLGQAVESDVAFSVPVDRPRDYVLSDGTKFATFAGVSTVDPNWTPAGFIFAHVAVADVTFTCLRGDTEVAEEVCDPLLGDTLVRQGEVDEDMRAVEIRMLESFRIIE